MNKDDVGTVVGMTMRAVIPPLEQRLAALEQREAAREAKPSIRFCGVWKDDHHYQPGDGVTHQGGLWICQRHQPGPPAQDFVGWQLAVKRGAAAK